MMQTPDNLPDNAEPHELTADGAARPTADRTLITAWLVSVAVHLALFLVMVAFPWVARTVSEAGELKSASTQLQSLPESTQFTVVPRQSPFENRQKVPRESLSHVTPKERDTLSSLSRSDKPDLSIVGIGTGGGESSTQHLRAGLGGGPTFFGLGGEARAARRIVYVVDRSGSMIGVFDALRKELKSSIDRLRKSQKFHVIFYSTDPPVENPPRRLINAIRAAKEDTFAFIDKVMPEGATQPLEAMNRAFLLKPDLIYFLSDGEIPVGNELLELLRYKNNDERVRIFTIAYVSQAGRPLLEQIAREHNGRFRYVSEYDLR